MVSGTIQQLDRHEMPLLLPEAAVREVAGGRWDKAVSARSRPWAKSSPKTPCLVMPIWVSLGVFHGLTQIETWTWAFGGIDSG